VGRQRQRSAGFTILEVLVVTVILAIMTAFFVPLAVERVRVARVRTTVNQFALDVRAARWTAVSGRKPVDMVVAVDPANSYEYTDIHGRVHRVEMPEGVRIVSSTNPIRFRENGSIPGGASTVIEMETKQDTISRWTLGTSNLGVTRTQHEQVEL
jgi:prepilin-type N-terminal cleavage/methylation domain-containing protein